MIDRDFLFLVFVSCVYNFKVEEKYAESECGFEGTPKT